MTFAKTARLLLSYVVEATVIGASDPCAARFRTARTATLVRPATQNISRS
ncbi:MAG: hypothetical protein KFB96_20620 [Thiocapsa sp.]|nr:hypothetical protein [Thiocapsa sp.]QVL48028.1 MAG: hypothetical protein KFB96_20620 [Thiocapsa sp.]